MAAAKRHNVVVAALVRMGVSTSMLAGGTGSVMHGLKHDVSAGKVCLRLHGGKVDSLCVQDAGRSKRAGA